MGWLEGILGKKEQPKETPKVKKTSKVAALLAPKPKKVPKKGK